MGNVLKLLINNIKVAFIPPNLSTNHFLSINNVAAKILNQYVCASLRILRVPRNMKSRARNMLNEVVVSTFWSTKGVNIRRIRCARISTSTLIAARASFLPCLFILVCSLAVASRVACLFVSISELTLLTIT
jgi:hypothetical protein